MQTLFQNGDEQIDDNRRPDWDAHRVGRHAVKGFDTQMLLDPFEEEFDLPAAAIELGDGQCRHDEVVGQKDQRLAGFWIAIADAAQGDGIIVLQYAEGKGEELLGRIQKRTGETRTAGEKALKEFSAACGCR